MNDTTSNETATNETVSALVKGVGDLVSLPEVFIRVNQLINDPASSAADAGGVIAQDPGLTARLLRLANSPLYAFATKIDTVSRAVAVLGAQQIRALVLATSVTRSFSGLPNELVSMENFWRHSLYCALAARHLTGGQRKLQPEVLFTAGLLHDVGELVIFSRLPQQARAALEMVLDRPENISVAVAEREVMGFDHAMVGGELARQWQLPPILETTIECHHSVGRAEAFRQETALIHLANAIAQLAEIDSLDPEDATPIDPQAWEIAGVTPEVIEPTVTACREQIGEAMKLFSPEAKAGA